MLKYDLRRRQLKRKIGLLTQMHWGHDNNQIQTEDRTSGRLVQIAWTPLGPHRAIECRANGLMCNNDRVRRPLEADVQAKEPAGDAGGSSASGVNIVRAPLLLARPEATIARIHRGVTPSTQQSYTQR